MTNNPPQYALEKIFPTGLLVSSTNRDFTEKEMQDLGALIDQALRSPKEPGCVITGTNTDVLSAVPDIKDIIQSAINYYMEEVIKASPELKCYITQSWINVGTLNDAHPAHRHCNSFLSGVLYVNAIRSKDNIIFYPGKTPRFMFDINPTEFNDINSSGYVRNVGTGDILIFPSDLEHKVPTFKGEHYRVSIAFNTFLKGELGDSRVYTHLKL